ncbi:hypothetical protein ECE50_011380 [Chitinophaga sp. Mgbs1]|uniref:Uncharacterized protein n=1 Tax=Chitinophaga solisilvae TaxID=1233460 RepID=A0A9Q5DA65_9BACT|nr:hypothetical protein [Chitinophaga solisilvae]
MQSIPLPDSHTSTYTCIVADISGNEKPCVTVYKYYLLPVSSCCVKTIKYIQKNKMKL